MIWKKKILAAAVGMGCVGALFAMLPTGKTVDAAVLVHDDKNIIEAAKTAINTANILTNAQKELALQIIDMTSMDAGKLEEYLKWQVRQQDEIFNEAGGKIGVLTAKSTPQAYWEENFKNIESILQGDVTISDAYNANQKALKALENTNYDALHNAKTTQTASQQLSDSVTEAVINSANAEGTKEAVQANTQAIAAAAMGVYYGNTLLSDMVAQQALKYQKENMDEANAMALSKAVAKQARNDVEAMKAALLN